jgi:hypothetical protein
MATRREAWNSFTAPTGSMSQLLAQSAFASSSALLSSSRLIAGRRFLEFFAATIRNKNTRMAYYRAVTDFFAWLDAAGIVVLVDIEPRSDDESYVMAGRTKIVQNSASSSAKRAPRGRPFKRGHEKLGGRKLGSVNRFSSDVREALLEAVNRLGADGPGQDARLILRQRRATSMRRSHTTGTSRTLQGSHAS